MKKARTKGGVSPARSSEGSSRLQTEGENAQEAQRKSKQGRGGVTEAYGVAVSPTPGEEQAERAEW